MMEAGQVDTELALLTAIFHTRTRQLTGLVLLQLLDLVDGVHDYLGRADGVDGVAGVVETAALLDCVEKVVAARADCLAGAEQDPQHPAELLHVVELEHLQLLLKAVLSHHHIDKLLLTIGTHR